ncbi:MAG: HAMP domain-containing sensor histidine kinase [Gammaproteobacteria bacterium]|nr:HAMP domain-containing sensor histidine kinase [Gammaproteobacteria bacterium]
MIVIAPLILFQLTQAFNWGVLLRKQQAKIISKLNLPYILSTALIVSVLIYFSMTSTVHSKNIQWYQSISIFLDMLAWLYAIICLARTKSSQITLLTLGCLMVVSSDLTSRAIFMFSMDDTISTNWFHIVWTAGVLIMALGFLFSIKNREFEFCHPKSLQVSSTSSMLLTSFFAFIVGLGYLIFLTINQNNIDIHHTLWNIPIALMFTMITTIIIAKKFTRIITLPLNQSLKNITAFNSGDCPDKENKNPSGIHEFSVLGEFINDSFKKLSDQLNNEIDLAAQVAHDIRSPLTSLDVFIRKSQNLEESKRILLRNAINDIRDITNNLEKNTSDKFCLTQIAPLIESVVSAFRVSECRAGIKISHEFAENYHELFSEITASQIKRIISNVINNAREAIASNPGVIKIEALSENERVKIYICNDGPGISKENEKKIFEKGFTTKENGSGLGLYSAKENLSKMSGSITVKSNKTNGVTFIINLPLCNAPSWFAKKLLISKNSSIVCIDDSESVCRAWRERINSEDVDLRYFKSKTEFLDGIEHLNSRKKIYLIDYEFSGQDYNGIDLIEMIMKMKITNKDIYLVTSRSGEQAIQNYCIKNNIYLIPKTYVPHIPILIN